MMRVLIISLTTYTSPYHRRILRALSEQVHVDVIAGDGRTLWSDAGTNIDDVNIRVFLAKPRFTRYWATTIIPHLRNLIEIMRPDIVHIDCEPWQFVSVQSILAARSRGVPAVIHFAENGPILRAASGTPRRALARWTLRKANHAIGWSTAATAIAADLAPGTPRDTFPSTGIVLSDRVAGRDEVWFGDGAIDAPRVVFAGRLIPEKGIRDALAAVDQVKTNTPVRVAIAGSGRLQPFVEDWVADRPEARFHGLLTREQVTHLFAAADVVLMPSMATPSWAEQFGLVAVEAMAVGTPVIAYHSGALPEVIGGGGILVPEGDGEALSTALREFVATSPATRAALTSAAQAQAAKFTVEVVADRLVDIWSQVSARSSTSIRGRRKLARRTRQSKQSDKSRLRP